MAYLQFKAGDGIWVLGAAQEVRDALADEFLYSEGGFCVLRFAHEEGLVNVDPQWVADVLDEVAA